MEEVPPSPATSGRRRRDRRPGGNRPGLGALAKGVAVRLEQGRAAAGDSRTEGAGERVSGAAGAAQRGSHGGSRAGQQQERHSEEVPIRFGHPVRQQGKQENRQE